MPRRLPGALATGPFGGGELLGGVAERGGVHDQPLFTAGHVERPQRPTRSAPCATAGTAPDHLRAHRERRETPRLNRPVRVLPGEGIGVAREIGMPGNLPTGQRGAAPGVDVQGTHGAAQCSGRGAEHGLVGFPP